MMPIPWKVVRAGFFDGFAAFILMFGEIKVPGSPSAELCRLTTPEALEEYQAIDPKLPAVMLRFRDNALARDRIYARTTRVLGCLELAATLAAVCFLALRWHS